MITADQLLAHLIGDYVLQSNWMATEKTKRFLPAAVHALLYSLGFLFFHPSLLAWSVILVTHFFIDRYRLARYVVWLKNFMCPLAPGTDNGSMNPPWNFCSKTGYSPDVPDWLAIWLLILVDNIMHIAINGLALRYL